MMRKSILALLMVSAVAAMAGQSDRTQVNLNTDSDGNSNPQLFIPIYWSENFFSGVGYYRSSTFETGDITGGSITDSSISTTVDQTNLRLNLLTYETASGAMTYAVGGEYEQIAINKHEFGYMEVSGTDIHALKNDIEIDVSRLNLKADATYKSGDFYARIGFGLSPQSSLSVDQTTTIKPLIPGEGTSSATKAQAMAYDLSFKSGYSLHPMVNLIVQAMYDYLPMKYDLAVASGGSYAIEEQDVEQTTTMAMVSFAFNVDSFSKELSPNIGFGTRSITTTDNTNDAEETVSESLIILGFEGRF